MNSSPLSFTRGSNLKWFAVIVISIACLIIFQPALSIGFWTDDYYYIDLAGRSSLSDYLRTYFDPLSQWRWYRPMQGIQWWIAYALFRVEPLGYHIMQILLHVINTLLLSFLTVRITRRLSVGLLAGLLYLTIPIYGLAVFWPAVVDPLLVPFYLLAVWFWLDYLERPSLWRYALSFAMFVGALMSKEVAATLPIVLFLLDRWVIGQLTPLWTLVKRYALFFGALIPYAFLELHVLTQGLFTAGFGYGPGLHVLSTLMFHLTTFVFPWLSQSDTNLVVAFIALGGVAYFVLRRKSRVLFLISTIVLTTLPVLMLPPNLARADRYLYLPLMGSAVGFAVVFERALRLLKNHWSAMPFPASLAMVLLLGWSGDVTAQSAEGLSGVTRQERIQFRPIFQRHPSFPPDTFLYFIDSPDPYAPNIMFTRYGTSISSDSTDNDRVVGLRHRTSALIFYLDDGNNWREQAVSKITSDHALPNPPVRFGDLIQLDGYELASDQLKRGDALIALLYWRALKPIDKDYTVFAHLVDRDGRILAGADRQPRNGYLPTTHWRPNGLVTDAILIPIPDNAPSGKDLRLEIGLYDLVTLQRLTLIGADRVDIMPIEISD